MITEFIKTRMKMLGYNPDDILIEPYTTTIADKVSDEIYPADNEFLFLYDCSNYTKSWLLRDDITQITSTEFIIDQKVPAGIHEVTGNIRVKTLTSGDGSLTLMFYKVKPGKKL